jgi:hypothetical protein
MRSVNRCAILLELREPMFMHVATMRVNQSSTTASPFSSRRIGGGEDGAGFEAVIFAPRITSDACSDVEHPHICGVCNGLYFRFPLEGAWRRRHITLTEACGTILALTIFAEYFPYDELIVESDATASLATAAAAAVANDLIYIRRRAEQVSAFQKATRRAWLLHCKGWANALSDAGSRDKMSAMYALAAAMGIRLREVPIPAVALAFMQDVIDNTSEADHGLAIHDTSIGTHNLSMSGDMPIAHLPMIELLLVLDEMLRIEEHERANCLGATEATERAIDAQARAVAECAGATLDQRHPNSALLIIVAIQAACRCLRRPNMFPSIASIGRKIAPRPGIRAAGMPGRHTRLLPLPEAGESSTAQVRGVGRSRLGRGRHGAQRAHVVPCQPRRGGRAPRCSRVRAVPAAAGGPHRVRVVVPVSVRARREADRVPRGAHRARPAGLDVYLDVPPVGRAATWRLAGVWRRCELARWRRRAQPVVRRPRARLVGSATIASG